MVCILSKALIQPIPTCFTPTPSFLPSRTKRAPPTSAPQRGVSGSALASQPNKTNTTIVKEGVTAMQTSETSKKKRTCECGRNETGWNDQAGRGGGRKGVALAGVVGGERVGAGFTPRTSRRRGGWRRSRRGQKGTFCSRRKRHLCTIHNSESAPWPNVAARVEWSGDLHDIATAGATLTSVGVSPEGDGSGVVSIHRGDVSVAIQRVSTLVEATPTVNLVAFHRGVPDAGVALRVRRRALSLQPGSDDVSVTNQKFYQLRRSLEVVLPSATESV